MPQGEKPADHAAAREGDKAAKKNDPHGVKDGGEIRKHEPTGTPNSDRHETETAAHRDK